MKTVVLGVSGGIAAYKAAALCSKLTQAGADVHVIMTENATEFVTPLSFMTLSRNPVVTGLFNIPEWRPEHVALADIADIAVIAPATANIIGKIANGIGDDALSTFMLTFYSKVFIAPAMNPRMYNNPAVQENIAKLKERGFQFIGPEAGHVACGAAGMGRMCEPDKIASPPLKRLKTHF